MPRKKPVRVELTDFLPDNQLVRRVVAGEAALFEILVHRHSQRVYRAARAILKDDDEAADVVQETFVRAYRKLGQFAGRAKFSTWLTRIGVYEALARRRKSRAHAFTPREPADAKESRNDPDTGLDPERSVLVREVRALMETAIEDLPDLYRTVFVMRMVEEMSTADTAEVLNLSQDAVKTRLRRARALLREKLHAAVGPLGREAFRFAGERCQRMWLQRILPAITVLGLPRARKGSRKRESNSDLEQFVKAARRGGKL
ncbi:MAG: RNA polymerase sigma factor [Acidobacteriota bacterium]|nr:RNA polymerase sigma factor [Acidobacteriota bacterium]MDQ5871270.1 RNA polymerase sigma factor [Acidobacteriota bacterium]